MIVVVSDLHLQHTSLDGVRREEGGRVFETRVSRNVGAGALALLFSEIVENAQRCNAREVHLVFAGDIFELHRTPLWFAGGEPLRPTLHPASSSAALERRALEILSAVERDNREFFRALAAFVGSRELVRGGESRRLSVPLIPHYIPGNHDRLIRCWPSTRQRARELLCIPGGDGGLAARFPHRLEWPRRAGYGVRVRHGHEYDPSNFSEAFDPARPPSDGAYEAPALGDYVTVDVTVRLAVGFRAHYARELRAPGPEGDAYRRIYAAITEFDDVRPQSKLVRYLLETIGLREGKTLAILRPVLRDVFDTALADSFFMNEAGPVLSQFTGKGLVELLSIVERFGRGGERGGPAQVARKEPGLESGEVSLIVAGHTHEPDHVALPGRQVPGAPRDEAYFLDSGTWRTRIDAGEAGAFGRLRSYTMVFCYHDDELRIGERRRFETWTGHLQAEDYGAVLSREVAAEPRAALQTLRCTGCRIQHVDEGETPDGAELFLSFGVDGQGHKLAFRGVHDGDTLTFPETTLLRADPALDGEVWCYGVEKDLGGSLLDRDDPLPWAVFFLSRVSDEEGAAFRSGQFELRAADNRGNAFTLCCEVL
ncbi:MAG TPA: hypothetical protein VG937_26510 [Polyangiaceae bacterium]|nr:hypothetical protein [Polyangiaceae bacterium]